MFIKYILDWTASQILFKLGRDHNVGLDMAIAFL